MGFFYFWRAWSFALVSAVVGIFSPLMPLSSTDFSELGGVCTYPRLVYGIRLLDFGLDLFIISLFVFGFICPLWA